ncbi:porin [Paraburkholderia sp. J8-2]|uniref:porin n=1 Tax=Paraburkholderia sp. J8-2 TaxID=2805440 RepID=UPI002AB6EC5F|nr:porin [Paraburkholderia sp. J8-2]
MQSFQRATFLTIRIPLHTVAAFIVCLGVVSSRPAHAQSNVTLYGLISVGISYSSNAGGKSLTQMTSGPQQPSRWGLRGIEDLGGGVAAIFVLENGFSITSGSASQGGRLFGRQAWVGLTAPQYGTITLGRQYDEMTQQLNWTSSAVQFATYGAHVGDNDNIFNVLRLQNSVRYVSPTLHGLSLAAQYAFSNQAGAFNNNSAFSSGLSYQRGPFRFSAAMSQYNHPDSTNTGGAIGDSYGYTSPFATSPGGAGVEKQRILGVGAGYDFGFVQTTLSYTNVLFNYLDTTGLRLNNVELSVTHRITPMLLVGAAYIYTFGKSSEALKPHYNQVNLGVDYFLSKRTDLYLVGLYQRAGGSAQYAQIVTTAASSTKSEAQVIAGIRTKF